MTDKLDYKKEYKDLYMPKNKPAVIDVPDMSFIMVDGKGDPNGNPDYRHSIELLYGLSFTIKMSKMKGMQPDGYFEYVVPPLEGLWWCDDGAFDFDKRDNWLWTSMIRQPEFVTEEFFEWACWELAAKRPELDIKKGALGKFKEGLCVQMMHFGPYAGEPASVEEMKSFMKQNSLADMTGSIRKHHEIYISDPRKTEPVRLRTILRHPVEYIR
jgi:hypothetical protein